MWPIDDAVPVATEPQLLASVMIPKRKEDMSNEADPKPEEVLASIDEILSIPLDSLIAQKTTPRRSQDPIIVKAKMFLEAGHLDAGVHVSQTLHYYQQTMSIFQDVDDSRILETLLAIEKVERKSVPVVGPSPCLRRPFTLLTRTGITTTSPRYTPPSAILKNQAYFTGGKNPQKSSVH